MKILPFVVLSGVLNATFFIAQGAQAQPNPQPNNAQPNNAATAPGETPREARERERERQSREREERRRTYLQTALRRQLERVGVTDKSAQEAVIEFVEKEQAARAELVESGREFARALRGDALTDVQVAALLNNYQATVEDDRLRRENAVGALKKVVPLAQNPRLEAQLVLLGVLGDGPPLVGERDLMRFGGAERDNRRDRQERTPQNDAAVVEGRGNAGARDTQTRARPANGAAF